MNVKSRTVVCLAILLVLSIPLCFSGETSHGRSTGGESSDQGRIRMPDIPRGALPESGFVTEYWPSGKLKSECRYKHGVMRSGAFYASNGQMVYEMVADQPEAEVPSFPGEARPDSGTISEFWPNGELKSESVFRNGNVTEASFFSSDGVLIYEVSADSQEIVSELVPQDCR